MISFLHLINLLEQLTYFRETFTYQITSFHERIQLRNSQIKEMHRARYVERSQNFYVLSRHTSIPESPFVHQIQKLSKPTPFGQFYGCFIIIDMVDLIIDYRTWIQPPSPLLSPEVRRLSFCQLTTPPHLPWVHSRSNLINITKDNGSSE